MGDSVLECDAQKLNPMAQPHNVLEETHDPLQHRALPRAWFAMYKFEQRLAQANLCHQSRLLFFFLEDAVHNVFDNFELLYVWSHIP